MTMTSQQVLDEAEAFLDLALGDDDLLRAEFDALIAACWESPYEPPLDKPCPPEGGWAPRPPSRWPGRPRLRLGLAPTRSPQRRERGPPRR
ncbi:hypothetical protein [Kribbella antiqua]|uniref:hypothetical protein n=1 Tax=Kribbella antiqua TaxID=2512217 RepID=UPI001048BE31|nr:hypothetical protein [Kribbella antiqua]